MFNKNKKVINIEGMKCEHCRKKVYDALSKIENVTKVDVNLKKKTAIITIKKNMEIDISNIEKIINDLGFIYKGIR